VIYITKIPITGRASRQIDSHAVNFIGSIYACPFLAFRYGLAFN